MAFQLLLSPRSDDQSATCGGRKRRSLHALDFHYLIGDALFELSVKFDTSSILSRSSLSSRAFSMAMTAWAAKFVTRAICLSVKHPLK